MTPGSVHSPLAAERAATESVFLHGVLPGYVGWRFIADYTGWIFISDMAAENPIPKRRLEMDFRSGCIGGISVSVLKARNAVPKVR